jgi:RNA polymerase-binding protein DksA
VPLTNADVDRFRERLSKRREELRWLIHDALVASKRQDYIEIAGSVHDAAEESVAELLADMSLATLDREVDELRDVEAALTRVADGVYGRCIACGDDIGRERLEAYPTAKRCLTCQTKHETDKRGGRDATPSL